METENKGFIIYDDSDTVNEITAALRCSEEVTDIEIPSEVGGKLVNTLRIVGVMLPKLRRLYIPSTVKDIEFAPCTTGSFEGFTVEIAPDNPWLTTDGKAVFTKDMSRLILFAARKDKTYKLPDGVKIIGKNAFMGCDCDLEELVLPDDLEVIEEQDYENAFEWYTKAAEQEDWSAYDRLGRLYENGNGVEADINKAVEMCRKSAENGSIGGMKDLARCYEEGIGVEKDLQKAKELKEKAGVS